MKTQKGFTTLGRALFSVLLMMGVSLYFVACDLTDLTGSESGTNVVSEPGEVLPPLTTPERTICDPFSSNSPVARDRGVVGNIMYLSDEMPRYTRARDYIDYGNIIQSTLYLDRLFVPTRAFDLGFTTQTGELVLNSNGQPMYEYFGLRLEGQMQLAANEADGPYQLAVLSDDGAVLYLKNSDGSLVSMVENDGNHPTKMGCAAQPLQMTAGQKVPFVLEYYQGPRYHISLVVMWRPWSEEAELECGTSGNSRFFDSTVVPSKAQPRFYEMLARGWKVLENENYYFPEQASNPCVPEEAELSISGFTIISTSRTSVTATWTSSIESYGQLQVRNITTGAVLSSDLSGTAGTSHTMTVSGLSPNTLYAVIATSTSEGGQTARSDERAIRTPR